MARKFKWDIAGSVPSAEDQIILNPDRCQLAAKFMVHRQRSVRAGFMALSVTLAFGAILGVRLISDQSSSLNGVLVGPTVGSTLDPAPTSLPTSTPSPSSSPSATPPADYVQYQSADGVWELHYPKDWYGPDVAPVGDFTNYQKSPKETALPLKLDLLAYEVESDKTLDDLLAEICAENPYREVYECEKLEINGRMWAWVRQYAEADEPAMALSARTIVDGKVYAAIGYVFAKSGQDPGVEQIREVLKTLVLDV